jgi:hypothetical protein
MAGTNYIEASQFFQIIKEPSLQNGQQEMPVYYFECVTDDCGWGYISTQPEFNKSMEDATKLFANYSDSQEDFQGAATVGSYYPFSKNKITEYRVYKLSLALNPAILDVAKQTHSWFLYPINYDRSISPIFDDYTTHGFGTLLKGFAWAIFYFELILAYFALFYVAYLFVKEA